MPALKPTDFAARVTWIGCVHDRAVTLRSEAVEMAELTFEGMVGETHAGWTRSSCARILEQHPKGTEIRNVRQISLVSAEDLAAVAETMGLEELDPRLLGASLVVEGIPDFSRIPPSSRLQAPDGTTLLVDMENRPCTFPAREIEQEAPGYGKVFRAAAAGRRGVTASVERPGQIKLGDALRLHIPDQPVWAHLEEARAQ